MNEEQIRKIVREELEQNARGLNPQVPQKHDGNDGFKINPLNLVGFNPIPADPRKYTNEDTGLPESNLVQMLSPGSATNAPQYLQDNTIATYPIPVIQGNGGGIQSQFNGGWLDNGRLIFFENGPLLSGLYIRVNGVYRGVNFPEVIL